MMITNAISIYQNHPSYNFEDGHEELLVAAGEVSQVTVCAWIEPKATNPVTRLNSSAAALEKTTSNPNPIQNPNRNPCYHVEFIHSSFGRE